MVGAVVVDMDVDVDETADAIEGVVVEKGVKSTGVTTAKVELVGSPATVVFL